MSTPAQSAHLQMRAPFGDYALGPAYDEMFRANGLASDEEWSRFLENDQQAEKLQAQRQLQQQ